MSARAHLPADCDLVARIDLKTLMASNAVKQHVAELTADAGAGAVSQGRDALADFWRTAGINPAVDLQEVAVCLRQLPAPPGGTGPVRHVIALAGQWRTRGLLDAITKTAPAGQYEPTHLQGIEALRRKGGRLFAQAEDGTILIGDDGDLLVAAREPGDRYAKYALRDGEISLMANRQVLTSVGGTGPTHPLASLLGQAQRLDLELHARVPSARVTLQFETSQQASQSERQLTGFLDMLREGPGRERLAQLLPPGTLEAIAAIRVTRTDSTAVLEAQLPEAALTGLYHRVGLLWALGS
jgi:hypothetical protein